MLLKSIIILIIISAANNLFGQNGDFSTGARSTSMAGTSVTLDDEWSIFNNIGGLSFHKTNSVFIGYQNKYGIPEFSSITAGFTHTVLGGTAGIGFFRFGDDLFNEQRINLGFSNQFGIVSLGIDISYFQLNIRDAGTRNALMINFGGLAKLTKQIYFGAHVSNLNQAKISKVTGENLPTIMKMGLGYRPNTYLILNIEVEKQVDQKTIFKIGMEYMILKKMSIATGFHTKPFESTFGIGFHPNKFDLNYAFMNNSDLGNTHEFSLTYNINR